MNRKFRIVLEFGTDPETGFPMNWKVVQCKRKFTGMWVTVEHFKTMEEAIECREKCQEAEKIRQKEEREKRIKELRAKGWRF